MAAKERCCVSNCGSTNTILHKFPHPEKDCDRFRSWLDAIGGDILALDNIYIYKYRPVCHIHFESKYYTRSKRLSCDAVPTLHLPGFPIRRRPMADITNERESGSEPFIDEPVASTSGQLESQQEVVVESNAATETPKISLKTSLKRKSNKNSEKLGTLQKKLRKVTKVKDNLKTRLKRALKLSENKTFQNSLKKFTTMAAIFTVLQFNQIGKPKMARRYSKNEKIMALSVYKLGPRAYRWLSKMFVLPSPLTLSRMIARANLKPGINENLFNQLKKQVQKMKDDDKLCTLMFDEMALTPHLEYNRRKDRIIGFVDDGYEVKRKIADHVLVFMIRGITKNYKQPIHYSFCAGSTPKLVLARLITDIIKKLQDIGLTVLLTVCDQGTTNTSAINHLINETKHNYLRKNDILLENVFEVNDKKVIPLYDVPHLLKGMRNNLITKNLKYSINNVQKTAKWEHITKLYQNNPTYKGLKLIKKLTENHCNPQKIPKMKVKFAAQLFSQKVGKTMGFLAENGLLPKECEDTADLMIFFDGLFDSLNGSYNNSNSRSGKELLRNVTPTSQHNIIWTEAKQILSSMKFVNKKGIAGTVPSITNWLRTVENMEFLRNVLFYKYNIKSFWCRHLNQDPLENFFGSIRSHGVRNNSPTCAAFEASFASLLVNNISSNYSPGSNCEKDDCDKFDCFRELFFKDPINKNQNILEIDINDFMNDSIIEDFNKKKTDPRIFATLQYVAGYVLRQTTKIIKKCKKCLHDLHETDINKDMKNYITFREFNSKKKYLTYPSEKFISLLSDIQDITDFILKDKSNITGLKNYIKTMCYTIVDFNFITCDKHKKEIIENVFDLTSRFFCYNWCRNTNKLLNGASKNCDNSDFIQKSALDYCNKRIKKK